MTRSSGVVLLFALLFEARVAIGAELEVRVRNAPAGGTLVFQVYDNASAFGDFRNPSSQVRFPVAPSGDYLLREIPAGTIALLVYLDENNNGMLDKNFIGIPAEPIGLSNNYRPRGPPSFRRASFPIASGETLELEIDLYQALGDFGQWGVGVGVIGRSSPYLDSDSSVSQVIPAITYFGERLQWVGPALRYGLVGSGNLRLALTASYRIGVYEEDESPQLEGLGDREDTLFAGLGLIYEGPSGIEFNLNYQQDVLDRTGGATATARMLKGYQFGIIRLVPAVAVNWMSDDLGEYDFGVPQSAARPGRPAYSPGDSIGLEAGLGGLVEFTENWRVAFSLAVEYLDDEVTDSPIVGEDYVVTGFAAVTYTF